MTDVNRVQNTRERMAIKHIHNDQGKTLTCELGVTAGCKKHSSIWASWDSGGARGKNKWVRRGLAVRNLPLVLLQLQESWQSPGVTESWFSLCLQSEFTGTESRRCKLSPLCPADHQYHSHQTRNLSASLHLQLHTDEEVQDAPCQVALEGWEMQPSTCQGLHCSPRQHKAGIFGLMRDREAL